MAPLEAWERSNTIMYLEQILEAVGQLTVAIQQLNATVLATNAELADLNSTLELRLPASLLNGKLKVSIL